MKSQQWFIDRIGKTIYRSENGCSCETCKKVHSKGLVIRDKLHASYLYDIQHEYEIDGMYLDYRE